MWGFFVETNTSNKLSYESGEQGVAIKDLLSLLEPAKSGWWGNDPGQFPSTLFLDRVSVIPCHSPSFPVKIPAGEIRT